MITITLFIGRILRSRLTYYDRHHLLITNDFYQFCGRFLIFLGAHFLLFTFGRLVATTKSPRSKSRCTFLPIGFLFSVRTFHFLQGRFLKIQTQFLSRSTLTSPLPLLNKLCNPSVRTNIYINIYLLIKGYRVTFQWGACGYIFYICYRVLQ